MGKRVTVVIATIVTSCLGVAAAADNRAGEPVRVGAGRACVPVLPILSQSVPTDVQGEGIRSCGLITSVLDWASFCAGNGLACDPYDDSFFTEWTMVAVVIDTVSPVICENAGPVPRWAVSCLTRRGPAVLARVETTFAGAACRCSLGPQFPTRLFLVDAIAAGRAQGCRAWPEVHLIECLGP